MIYADLSGINSCIEAAEKLSHGIIRDGGSVSAVEKASELDKLLKDIQVYLVDIQSEYIRLAKDKDALEQELIRSQKSRKATESRCQCSCRPPGN
jgi:hypothetical protein